ncbi:MAG: hypothetical protein R2911_23410 [Caldilineaceae bacterium]
MTSKSAMYTNIIISIVFAAAMIGSAILIDDTDAGANASIYPHRRLACSILLFDKTSKILKLQRAAVTADTLTLLARNKRFPNGLCSSVDNC